MINGPAGGDFEECGDTTSGLSMSRLAFNQLTVVFRTSEVVRDVGFESMVCVSNKQIHHYQVS